MHRILVTGAAGKVATGIRSLLARHFPKVRLTDLAPVNDLAPNEEWVAADLGDPAAVAAAVAGVDGIVHLGALGREAPFAALIPANILGVVHVLDAARAHGVRRVVLASSLHTMGLYRRDERFDSESVPRPDSRYAVTKLFAENLGRLYAAKFGLEITCLRLGHFAPSPDQAEPGNWIGPRDLVQLIRAGLEHPDVTFEVLHAVALYDGDDLGQRKAAARFGVRLERGGSYRRALSAMRAYFGNDQACRLRGGAFACSDEPMI